MVDFYAQLLVFPPGIHPYIKENMCEILTDTLGVKLCTNINPINVSKIYHQRKCRRKRLAHLLIWVTWECISYMIWVCDPLSQMLAATMPFGKVGPCGPMGSTRQIDCGWMGWKVKKKKKIYLRQWCGKKFKRTWKLLKIN